MYNEILLVISLTVSFSSLLIFHRFFGKSGIYVWIALCAVLANIEVTVLVHAFGMEQTLGNMLFASSFLATDSNHTCAQTMLISKLSILFVQEKLGKCRVLKFAFLTAKPL